jgi:hypothetical protein
MTAAGRELKENNSETLAFLGGKIVANDNASVLDKQHAYWAGAAVEKSRRAHQRLPHGAAVFVLVAGKLGNKVLGSGPKAARSASRRTCSCPLRSSTTATAKSDGIITLTAKSARARTAIHSRFASGRDPQRRTARGGFRSAGAAPRVC